MLTSKACCSLPITNFLSWILSQHKKGVSSKRKFNHKLAFGLWVWCNLQQLHLSNRRARILILITNMSSLCRDMCAKIPVANLEFLGATPRIAETSRGDFKWLHTCRQWALKLSLDFLGLAEAGIRYRVCPNWAGKNQDRRCRQTPHRQRPWRSI